MGAGGVQAEYLRWRQFFAVGLPKAQPRPRACLRGRHAAVYNPGTADGWKGCVGAAAVSNGAIPPEPMCGAVSVMLGFFFPRPRSHYRSGRYEHLVKESAPSEHLAKPDVDNLAKAVLDKMTELGFWRDDSQIVSLVVSKSWVSGSDRGGCRIGVAELRRQQVIDE